MTTMPAKKRGTTLPLGLSERRLLLVVVDVLVLNLALALALILRQGVPAPTGLLILLIRYPESFALLTIFWLVMAPVLDAYDLKKTANPFTSAYTVTWALAATCLTYVLVSYVAPPLFQSRLAWVLLVAFAVGLMVAWRAIYAVVLARPLFQRRALIVGAGQSGTTLLHVLREMSRSGYHVCGFIDDDPAKRETTVDGVPVLGTSRDLVEVAQREGASEVIVAITHLHEIGEPLFRAIMGCHEQGIHVTTMPIVYEDVTGRVAVEHIGRRIHLFLPPNPSSTHRLYAVLKRLADIGGSIVGLAVFAVCLPFILVAIKLDSRGPVFYTQERVGKGGQVFRVIKLRSMMADGEQDGQAVWATRDDERITRVGRFLRRVHLDEFPQFVNVLKGEMSLIGPRPERPQFVAQLAEQIPFYRARHAVKPGLTGWAQIKYRYGNTVEDALIKLQYDLYYIKHRSLYLDLFIAAKTVLVMLSFKGT
ncbi:MAG: sugar transferase [Chloroflexi bacterium]|nr:sugar transferase [Chloroflexota bacterium]